MKQDGSAELLSDAKSEERRGKKDRQTFADLFQLSYHFESLCVCVCVCVCGVSTAEIQT